MMQGAVRAVVCAAVAAVLLAGCGSSSPSESPVATELSYFPSGSPLLLSVATDPNSTAIKNTMALVNRFPLATFGETALLGRLQQYGIDYQSDIKPLFGNPIILGASGSLLSSGATNSNYLFVWVTKDAGKLSALLKKAGLHSVGSHGGATLYQSGATTLAVDGATAILGPTEASVDSAIDRHAHGGGMTQQQYTQLMDGLPQDGLMQLAGNLTAVLSQPSAAKARRVPWVAALRGYAASVSASSTGLMFRYRLDTSGATLSPSQVPFAAGTTPVLAGQMPITVGIQDPAHIVQFVEQAQQAASPASYAKFQAGQSAVRKKTGVDLNSLVSLLTGNLIVASDTHMTMGRAEVTDTAKAASDLSKLASSPRSVFTHARSVTRLRGGFYVIHEPKTTLIVGVAAKQLVVGKASVARLRAFASAPTTAAAGAQGSVAFRVAVAELLHLALPGSAPQILQQVLSTLGHITGWVASTPAELTGSATLGVR